MNVEVKSLFDIVLSEFFYLDFVLRTHYYKYFHPKECLVSNGILNRAITKAAGKQNLSDEDGELNEEEYGFVILAILRETFFF